MTNGVSCRSWQVGGFLHIRRQSRGARATLPSRRVSFPPRSWFWGRGRQLQDPTYLLPKGIKFRVCKFVTLLIIPRQLPCLMNHFSCLEVTLHNNNFNQPHKIYEAGRKLAWIRMVVMFLWLLHPDWPPLAPGKGSPSLGNNDHAGHHCVPAGAKCAFLFCLLSVSMYFHISLTCVDLYFRDNLISFLLNVLVLSLSFNLQHDFRNSWCPVANIHKVIYLECVLKDRD